MDKNITEQANKSNKTAPIIIALLGILYGVSPVDIIPDMIPVAGWVDDLVITGGTLLNLAQAFTKDTSIVLSNIFKISKWILWILGVLILLSLLIGINIYELIKSA
jgi:hypothetical protein